MAYKERADRSLTIDQVAALLRITPGEALRRDSLGQLPFVRVTGDRYIGADRAVDLVLEGRFDVAHEAAEDARVGYARDEPNRLAQARCP
jgi:hypothetical protein